MSNEQEVKWYAWTCYARPVSSLEFKADGTLPRWPYKVFESEEEAWKWMESKGKKRQ